MMEQPLVSPNIPPAPRKPLPLRLRVAADPYRLGGALEEVDQALLSEAASSIDQLVSVLDRLRVGFANYLDSDKSHECAHRHLVDYELFEAAARTVENVKGSPLAP